MNRRDFLKRVIAVPLAVVTLPLAVKSEQYGLFNPKADLAKQYRESKMSIRFIQQWNADADRAISRYDCRYALRVNA